MGSKFLIYKNSKVDLEIFNERVVEDDFIASEEILTLSTNNYKVNTINSINLRNIDSKEYVT